MTLGKSPRCPRTSSIWTFIPIGKFAALAADGFLDRGIQGGPRRSIQKPFCPIVSQMWFMETGTERFLYSLARGGGISNP